MDNELYDCIIVKNEAERIPVRTNIEGIKHLAEIHGVGNVLMLRPPDGSPYTFPEATLPAIGPALSDKEAVHEDEDKPKRKIR